MPEASDYERLEAKGMAVAYGGLKVVEDVSLEIEKGAILGLVGPNGSGKTSLVNAISGFVECEGEIVLTGPGGSRGIGGRDAAHRARMGLRRTFQTPQLFPTLSVLETVAASCARFRRHRYPLWMQSAGLPPARREFREDLEVARTALDWVGIADLADESPHELSLGQQRVVEVARAVANPGSTLLLDEPFAGLHRDEREVLMALLRRTVERGWGVLVVDHNLEVIEQLVDTVVVMDRGHVLARGEAGPVLADPKVKAAYTGEI